MFQFSKSALKIDFFFSSHVLFGGIKRKFFDVPLLVCPFPLVRLQRHLQTLTLHPTPHLPNHAHTQPFCIGMGPNWVCTREINVI